MTRRRRFDEVERGLVADIVTVLDESADGLTDEAGRRLWRRQVNAQVEGVPQEIYAVPRQEFVGVVSACAAQDEGLAELVDVTRTLAPALGLRLQPLVDEWRAHRVYAGRDWHALRDALHRPLAEPGDLAGLFALSTGGRRMLPAHSTTPWQAFVNLADLNSGPGELPSSMVFLEHLAQRPELASAVTEIRAWNDHFAAEWELLDDSGLSGLRKSVESTGRAARSGPVSGAAGRQEPRPPIRLYICVSPDRTPQPGGTRRRTPRYHVSARLNFPDSATLHPEQEPEARAPVTRRQLNARVAELLTRVAELCHHRSDPVALDFFLPLELLDEPVEWWNRDPTLDYDNPLFHAYEVTVHSLERMQRSRFHNAWRRRWARWQENRTNGRSVPHPNGEVHVCLPDPSLTGAKHLSRLGATVGGNNDVVGLLLCEPPWRRGTLGEREVGLALDLGVAVLMYHRPGGAAAPWRDALAEAGLAGLPRLANQWRFAADMEKTGTYDPAVIRAMAMVYDDPEQLLDGGPTAPVTFVGGTE